MYNHEKIPLKGLGLTIVFLILQQLIVASSSIWITRLIVSVSEEQPNLLWLWLYLASLILPYLPGALALVQLCKCQVNACVAYFQKFSELYPGRIAIWSNSNDRSTHSSILSGEACPTINGYVEYIYHLLSSAFNVFMNIFVLAILIDLSLLVTYAIGVVLAVLILYFQKNLRTKLALKAQNSRIQWVSLILKAWDNILLNNSYNLNMWVNKALRGGKSLIGRAIFLEKFNQSIGILMAFALLLPSLILVSYFAVQRIEDLAALATLIVILPRLFQILTYSYELLFLASDFPMQKAKLNTVLSLYDLQKLDKKNQDLSQRIQWEKIQVKSQSQGTISAKELLINVPKAGRITVQGDNGSGKTSFLLMVKQKHNDRAFYLPSKHDLLFKAAKAQLSTGQHTSMILKELKLNVKAPFILLDEWDANLDAKNRKEISSLIDELSMSHCVLEVLHPKNHQ